MNSFDVSLKTKTCCFTGHRKIPARELNSIKRKLKSEVIGLIDKGVSVFITGGALGFDTLASLTVLKIKRRFPDIRLFLALPCAEQTRGWRDEDVRVYEQILKKADSVFYVSKHYDTTCMKKRNRYLVDNSIYCISYLAKPLSPSGTMYTVKYANRKGLTVINIANEK